VLEVMRELGTDLSDRTPQLVTHEIAEWADIVVTMGCGDQCPYIPGKRYLGWDLPDPACRPIDEVRATRDEIASCVRELIAELDSTPVPSTGQIHSRRPFRRSVNHPPSRQTVHPAGAANPLLRARDRGPATPLANCRLAATGTAR
jgi:hypothetical protein